MSKEALLIILFFCGAAHAHQPQYFCAVQGIDEEELSWHRTDAGRLACRLDASDKYALVLIVAEQSYQKRDVTVDEETGALSESEYSAIREGVIGLWVPNPGLLGARWDRVIVEMFEDGPCIQHLSATYRY